MLPYWWITNKDLSCLLQRGAGTRTRPADWGSATSRRLTMVSTLAARRSTPRDDTMNARSPSKCTVSNVSCSHAHAPWTGGGWAPSGVQRQSHDQTKSIKYDFDTHTHTHAHTPFNGPLSGTTRVGRHQKVKPIWILLKQETVSGSGIS